MAVQPSNAARWRTVAIVFVILNLSLGVNFGSYGTLLGAVQKEFETSAALAAGGLSMLTLALGLLSPLVGGLMRKTSLKLLMAIGIVLNAIGYVVLSQVHGIVTLLAVYGLLIGPGFCLFSVVTCTAVISNWFDEGRGKALGIINMPIGNTLMPLVAAACLAALGLRGTFLANAAILLALLPLLLVLREKPLEAAVAPAIDGEIPPAVAAAAPLTSGQILRLPPFLILTLGVGVLSAGGMMMVTHMVALGMGRGLGIGEASLLLSAFGIAGVASAPAFGWLADKVGGGRAFGILCFCCIPPWLAMMVAGGSLPVLLLLAFLIGACSNALMGLFGLTMGAWLGQANLGLAMGMSYLLQIPFLFGAGPLAGAMFDATGSYTATILMHVVSFAVMGLIFFAYRPRPYHAA